MKKIVFLVVIICIVSVVKAQVRERLSFASTVGTSFAMSVPKSMPFTWQILGYYNFNDRWAGGIGTGLSFYEKILVPLFGDVRFNLTRPRRYVPYLECGVGYSFASAKDACGGFYLNPSVGVQYTIGGKKKVLLAVGYERQAFERLKKHENRYFTAEFKERLYHDGISLRIGFMF